MIDVTNLKDDIDLKIDDSFIFRDKTYSIITGKCGHCAFYYHGDNDEDEFDCNDVKVKCVKADQKDSFDVIFKKQ